MKSSKKIILAIIIALILLLIAGAAFAYAYIATDIFRTDKEMFFKYFAQITAEENGFVDKRLQQFDEKKKQNPYENSGEITAEVEYPNEDFDKVIEKVKDLTIRFSGKTDLQNQKVDQNIQIDYGNDVMFPISYRQDGNKFGLKFDELSKQYIAIKNENLDELIRKVFSTTIDDTTESLVVEDTYDVSEIINTSNEANAEIQEFIQQNKDELQNIYGNILNEQLLDENFTRTKNDNNETYTLELTREQIKNIFIKILEATKQNTLVLDKLNEIIQELYPEEVAIDVAMLDDIIESLNEEDVTDIPNIKIALTQSNKQLNQIILQQDGVEISIFKTKAEDSLSYDIACKMKEDVEENTSIMEEKTEPMEYNVYFNMHYRGLQKLANVQENYEFGFAIENEEETMKYDYTISNNTEFKESISVEELNEDVAVFLNEREGEQIRNFLTNVGTKLLEINKNQMTKLGLEEYENPLLCSNPITMLVISNFNNASDTITDTTLDYETQ